MITGLMFSAMILSIQSGAIYTGIKMLLKKKTKREKETRIEVQND